MKKISLDGHVLFFVLTKQRIEPWSNNVQISRGDIVFSSFQVFHSIAQTIRAFERGTNISRKFNIELLVRLSGQNQINKAIDLLNPNRSNIFLIYGILDNDVNIQETNMMVDEKALLEVYGTTNKRLIISKISSVSVR